MLIFSVDKNEYLRSFICFLLCDSKWKSTFWRFNSLLIFLHPTRPEKNIHNISIWCPRRHRDVLCTFNLGDVSTGTCKLLSGSCWSIQPPTITLCHVCSREPCCLTSRSAQTAPFQWKTKFWDLKRVGVEVKKSLSSFRKR